MKHRNPLAVILLTFITFGIYGLVWHVKTKNEMNKLGADIPTALLLIVPFVNLWWLWKYSEGVDKVTNSKMSTVLAFVLLFLLGIIGAAIIQNEFNSVGSSLADPAIPSNPVAADTLSAGPNPYEPSTPAAPAAFDTAQQPGLITPSQPQAVSQVTTTDPTTGQPTDPTSLNTPPQV